MVVGEKEILTNLVVNDLSLLKERTLAIIFVGLIYVYEEGIKMKTG